MEEATVDQPQLLRTKSTMGYSKASIGNAGSLLGLEVCPRHQMFEDLEKGCGPILGNWDVDDWQTDNWQGEVSDGSCSLTDLESSDGNPPTTPDTEDFVLSKSLPPTCVPPRLEYSKALTCFNLLMSNVDKGIGESACLELVERLDLLKTTNHICQLLDFFLVSLYHWDIYRRFLFLIQKTDTDGCFTHTTIIVLFKADPPFQTPQWLLCVIERENWSGRWLNEVSIKWVDTTWRTAFSVLHVGSISPVASLPRVTPGRLKALWEVQRLLASDAASEQPCINTAIPVRTRPNGQKRPSSNNARIQAQETGKRQRTGNGREGQRQQDEEPEDSSSDNEAPKEPDEETNANPSDSNGRQFACHFHKLDPHKYGKCRYRGQTATRHVKRHLIRSHKAPMYCPSCYKDFGAHAEWDRHIVERGCEQNTGSNPWGGHIKDDVVKKLDNLGQTKGDIEKWFKLWDILFPHKPRPSSPFVDSDNGVETGSAVPNVEDRQAELFRQSLEELQGEGVLNAEQARRVMVIYTHTSGIGEPSRPGPSNEAAGPGTSTSYPSVAPQQQPTQTGRGSNIRGTSTTTALYENQPSFSTQQSEELLLRQLESELRQHQQEEQRRRAQQQHIDEQARLRRLQEEQRRWQGLYGPSDSFQTNFHPHQTQRPQPVHQPIRPSDPNSQRQTTPSFPITPPNSTHRGFRQGFLPGTPHRSPYNSTPTPSMGASHNTVQTPISNLNRRTIAELAMQNANRRVHDFNRAQPNHIGNLFGTPSYFTPPAMSFDDSHIPNSNSGGQQASVNQLYQPWEQIMMPDSILNLINPEVLQKPDDTGSDEEKEDEAAPNETEDIPGTGSDFLYIQDNYGDTFGNGWS